MRQALLCVLTLLTLFGAADAASKPHVINLGKWTTVSWSIGQDEHPAPLKVRGLFLDGHLKEFVLGAPHDITDRLFVARRAFRLNDLLPDEPGVLPHWRWERGGWLLIDRLTGRISPLNLPEFDPYSSVGLWYRDYFAYCGVSDNAKKLFAVVTQLGARKPILKQPLGEPVGGDAPDSACKVPIWQRQPARVTFETKQGEKVTYSIRGHAVDVVSEPPEESNDEQ